MGANENLTWWQRIRGTAQIVRDLEASRTATLRLAAAEEVQGRAAEEAGKRSFLMNQVMFTGRRLLYGVTLGAIAAGGALSAMGFKFNLSMEQNRVALKHFLGSTELTNKELSYMYNLAATTPFQFQDLATATRKFLAFGYTLQDTNKYMKIIGDTVAGIGGTSADIEGLVTVFGQIQATGKVMGQDMLQLSSRGIPALPILRRELHLTQQQMGNLGRAAIPASVAIPALMRGMAKQFGGSAREQAKTLQGQLSTLHDYASQLMGSLTLPMFNRFRDKIMPQLNAMITEMQKAAAGGAGMTTIVGILDKHLHMGGRVVNIYKTLNSVFIILKNTLVNGVIPALYITSKVFSGVYFVVWPLLQVLKFLTKQQWLLMGVLIPLIALLSIQATVFTLVKAAEAAALVIRLLTLRTTGVMIIRTAILNWLKLISYARTSAENKAEVFQALQRMKMVRIITLLIAGNKAWGREAWTVARAENGQFKAGFKNNNLMAKMYRLIDGRVIPSLKNYWKWLRREVVVLWQAVRAQIAANLALLGWIGLAIAAIGAMVYLYIKWKRFHDIVDQLYHLLAKYPVLIALLVPAFGPFLVIAEVIRGIVESIAKLVDIAKHPIRFLAKIDWSGLNPFHKKGGGFNWGAIINKNWKKNLIPRNPFPGFFGAAGGIVPRMANVIVGERGPEVLSLPGGSSIQPLPQPTGIPGQAQTFPRIIQLHTHIDVDGRQLAEVVSMHRLDRKARR